MDEFIVNVCRNNIRPSIIPHIEKKIVDGKKIVIVSVPVGDTPYSTNKGLYFIRVGATKQPPTQQELLRLFQKRNLLQLDETPVLRAGPDSINLAKVDMYLKEMGQSRLDVENSDRLVNDLKNLSVLIFIEKEIYPTLGGLLAFGKNPQRYFPSYSIRCGSYNGNDLSADTVREKDLNGTLDELIEDAVAFVKLTIPQDHTLERGVKRKDTYLYPIEVIREGVVNAVCHRDYGVAGSAIRIFCFLDRIEIHSPGGLPNTLTVDSMIYRQFSRNQTVSSFLAGFGYMERRGKGMLRMMQICKQRQIGCNFFLTPDKSEFVLVFTAPKP